MGTLKDRVKNIYLKWLILGVHFLTSFCYGMKTEPQSNKQPYHRHWEISDHWIEYLREPYSSSSYNLQLGAFYSYNHFCYAA